MPTRTYAQTLAMLTALEQEIDLSVNDKLSLFAFELIQELKQGIEPYQLKLKKQERLLRFQYAQLDSDGNLMTLRNRLLLDRLNEDLIITPANEALITQALDTFKTTFTAVDVVINETVCPPNNRMNYLSSAFVAMFNGILVPAGYKPTPSAL